MQLPLAVVVAVAVVADVVVVVAVAVVLNDREIIHFTYRKKDTRVICTKNN